MASRLLWTVLFVLLIAGCASPPDYPLRSRGETIPPDAVKVTPSADASPPVLHSAEFEEPVPLPEPVSTAGAEDSPFIPAGRDELYFVFTPDVRVPVERQLLDGATGIYVSRREAGVWGEPQRIILQDRSKLSLDGCEFVNGDTIWFCTAREGYTGLHWARAAFADGAWGDWRVEDFPPEDEVGELHFSADWSEVYFHSARPGGKGSNDIWMMRRDADGGWQQPVNVEAVNTPENEGMPYLTPDGGELWFHRWYRGTPAVFRSKNVGGVWQPAEMIVSQFAGEPTLDSAGNLYFVHHFYKDGVMLEADIYVAERKS